MSLPLVNIFIKPYEVWTKKEATNQETRDGLVKFSDEVNDELMHTVSNAFEAASYIAQKSDDCALEAFVNLQLDKSIAYRKWRTMMPSKTPPELLSYKKNYPLPCYEEVNNTILENGVCLSEGQFLFHGGKIFDSNVEELILDRPLSTTFCPQIALRSAEWKAKAYDAGKVDLIVLHVTSPKTQVFAFKRKQGNLAHENEVLFAKGAKLTLKERTLIDSAYSVRKIGDNLKQLEKKVGIYVLDVDIS